MNQQELGSRITKLRKQKGMTQMELAEKCNITTRTIQRIEAGVVSPHAFTLRKLSEVFGVEMEVAVGDDRKEKTTGNKENAFLSSLFFLKNTESIIRFAIVNGLINLFFAIAEIVIEFIKLKYQIPSDTTVLLSVFVYFSSFFTYMIYLCGLFVIGRAIENNFLAISTIAIMMVMLLIKGHDVFTITAFSSTGPTFFYLRHILFGIPYMMLGISWLLKKRYGIFSFLAAIFECLYSLILILGIPFPTSLIFLVAVRIVETMLLYRINQNLADQK
jgi:transcriptional regulator with XRE-family HTH domain